MTALLTTPAPSPETETEVPAGAVRVPVREGRLTAIVGSSVAVCLWDPQSRVGGLSHFVVPCRPAQEPSSARYGDVAVALLVEKLRAAGGPSSRLVARLYGGASVLRGLQLSEDRLGARNVAMARIVLASLGISVETEDVGGKASRKVVFDLADGSVRVTPVP